ncbi:GNAT family N-acetyltransferase [Butyrivibrio hungatei]|uniref:GNAT family acetyltransferase n=1 Tax=Butyrivibrio hungatei TaxID=185008 RepID=A0A1D9NXF6_9FIRM|nr:GNAT family N-acetyltransferase [Butyrivibrio hungatei]AOZ95047.1 GNAT family acetyltransferase [Butyrivibrio hungatei]
MEELYLMEPTEEYLEQITEYRDEFLNADSSMDGTSALRLFEDAKEWLDHLKEYSDEKTIPEGKVPSTLFLFMRKSDDRILGMIDIRHRLNDYLLNYGGNIGYSIRPSERQKGYAKEMLRQTLPFCKSLGLDKVLITCNDYNEGSRKTILANGGVFENTSFEPDEQMTLERYWIKL